VKTPRTWEYGLHEHDADRRGLHLDLRLGDPATGHAHSWALQPKMPAPGDVAWAIQQPTHTVEYMDFKGRIPEGYGKGDVVLKDRAKTEILNATPDHITFAVYRGQGPEEYTLHRIDGNKWKFYNRTLTRDKVPDLPLDKPKYKDGDYTSLDPSKEETVWSAKIDDAHNLFFLPKDGRVRVISYRPTSRPSGVIEHTHKIESLHNTWTPKDVAGTVLRGGLYALNPETGNATPNNVLAGMLNANVWKSRDAQKVHGKLIPVIYDVVMYKGREMSNAPYEEKLHVLQEVNKAIPSLVLPRMAKTRDEKIKLKDDIAAHRLPETKEGLVVWPLKSGDAPIKAKITKEHDVYVKEIFPGEGRLSGASAGGFTYAHDSDGDEVGRVGTGLSDSLRRHMWENKDNYKGMVATVSAQDKYDSGALRAPSFLGWHLDKNDQTRLDAVKHSGESLGKQAAMVAVQRPFSPIESMAFPGFSLGKAAAHAHIRMEERSSVDPKYVDTINNFLRKKDLPRMQMHLMLPDGAVMQIIPIGRKTHVVSTVLPKGTRPKGPPLGAVLSRGKIPIAPLLKNRIDVAIDP